MKQILLISLGAAIVSFCLILYKCSQPDILVRYDRPIAYAKAIKESRIDLPLPVTSSDIYYGFYGDWQAYSKIARFTAPVDDCIDHIDEVISWHDHINKRKSSFSRKKITKTPRKGAGWLDPAHWFTPHSIKNGLYISDSSRFYTPQIWIDLDKEIFYFYEGD